MKKKSWNENLVTQTLHRKESSDYEELWHLEVVRIPGKDSFLYSLSSPHPSARLAKFYAVLATIMSTNSFYSTGPNRLNNRSYSTSSVDLGKLIEY